VVSTQSTTHVLYLFFFFFFVACKYKDSFIRVQCYEYKLLALKSLTNLQD
jgi:hypothetical protein